MANDSDIVAIKFELYQVRNKEAQTVLLAESVLNTRYLTTSTTPKSFVVNLETNNNIIGKM